MLIIYIYDNILGATGSGIEAFGLHIFGIEQFEWGSNPSPTFFQDYKFCNSFKTEEELGGGAYGYAPEDYEQVACI